MRFTCTSVTPGSGFKTRFTASTSSAQSIPATRSKVCGPVSGTDGAATGVSAAQQSDAQAVGFLEASVTRSQCE